MRVKERASASNCGLAFMAVPVSCSAQAAYGVIVDRPPSLLKKIKNLCSFQHC